MAALVPGERVVVAQGAEVPVDGVVIEGDALVQMALLTGESAPRSVGVGAEVVAGAVVTDGNLVVRVVATGNDTLLARMARRLAEALDRPVTPTLADRVAPAFTAGTLLVAAGAGLGWGLFSGPDAALGASPICQFAQVSLLPRGDLTTLGPLIVIFSLKLRRAAKCRALTSYLKRVMWARAPETRLSLQLIVSR